MKISLVVSFFIFINASYSLTPEEAIHIARSKMPPLPKISLGSLLKPYKKVTKSSLQMGRRNALVKAAYRELMLNGTSRKYTSSSVQEAMKCCGEELEKCNLDKEISCNKNQKYRTINGLCNNLHNPRWGAKGFPFRRIIPARYGNEESKPTTNAQHYPEKYCLASGEALPNPRAVSSGYVLDKNVQSGLATHMLTQFGQFLDHDITLTPEAHVDLPCCEHEDQEECLHIPVDPKDIFFSKFKVNCLELTRSEQFCDARPREQFNEVTSFIDASNVYGSEEELAELLRVPDSYLLKTTLTSSGNHLLPKWNGSFIAGDERSNEMPGLATMHNLFVREHNRIAKILAEHRGSKTKEDIFQEARRIVGAEMQNIVYGEYLMSLFGYHLYKYDLYMKPMSYYNPYADPSATNSFATAAYRFGHTMVEGTIERRNIYSNEKITTFELKDNFNNLEQYMLNDGRGMEEIIAGLFNQPSQNYDNFVADDVTNFLFREEHNPFGQDLVSRNIQRSRDHGLPPYGAFREACGLSPICNWSTRPASISSTNWYKLKNFYKNPNDMDLFIGGISETPMTNSVLGETFACIIGRQFRDLRDGDRFFFTHWGQSGSFNQEQIANLKGRTLAQIICDNTEISTIPFNVFRRGSFMIKCPPESNLNLNLFK